MTKQLIATAVGAALIIVMAIVGVHASNCASAIGCSHAAPAPLLAAGIPAFAALGGGVAVRQLWRRFARRR
jgi:hypothetical protein